MFPKLKSAALQLITLLFPVWQGTLALASTRSCMVTAGSLEINTLSAMRTRSSQHKWSWRASPRNKLYTAVTCWASAMPCHCHAWRNLQEIQLKRKSLVNAFHSTQNTDWPYISPCEFWPKISETLTHWKSSHNFWAAQQTKQLDGKLW